MSGLLGQLAPSAASWQNIYTCPASTVCSLRVIVSNRTGVDTTFRVAASKNGDAIANKHWISSDKPIAGNDTGATIGFVISAGDIVRVWSGNGELSFTATGETRAE